MGKLFGKSEEPCGRWQAWFESAAADSSSPGAHQRLDHLSSEDQAHLQSCADCRIATDAWFSVRESLRSLPQHSVAPPWFAARVLAAIAAREEDLRPAAAWIAVPKFASRLAWASAAVLLFAGAWLYQRPPVRPSAPPSAAASSEGLFDSQLADSNDEALISAEQYHE